MASLWLETFQFHRWANLTLLGGCESLSVDQLQLSSLGTYGTIAATLQHLVAAEQRYVKQLGGDEPQLNEHDDFPGLARLKELAVQSCDALLVLAERMQPGDTFLREFRGEASRVSSGIVALQALHHGNDHRTHVGTILGQNDLESPPIDVWTYGATHGLIVPVEPPGATG